MSEEEIKDYLKRVDELDAKLTGEDKETLQWLLFGYNECARLLNEKEQENKQLKEVIEEVREYILNHELVEEKDHYVLNGNELLQILDKAKENK